MSAPLLIQYLGRDGARAVGLVRDSGMVRLNGVGTVLELASRAIAGNSSMADLAAGLPGDAEDYAAIITEARLLSPVDHPDPAHCLVSGTGLTHLGSASTRAAMHEGAKVADETDSMKMFRWGVEGGKPPSGEVGAQPEWFYKGDGSIVVAPGAELPSPAFALDSGEEPELVGVYLIDPEGQPRRLGFAIGNEFSDHVTERANYLWLAHSKLRACAFGPELRLGSPPSHIQGHSEIIGADGQTRWSAEFLTGEENMTHTLANLEHHHFKYAQFCRPGDLHVHFFGTATLSFADGIKVAEGESFRISAEGFGAPLVNRLGHAAEVHPFAIDQL